MVWAPGRALPAIYLEDGPGANCPTVLNANFLNHKWNCRCFWPSLFPGAESKMRESNCLHCRELRRMAGLLCGRLESHPFHVQPLLSYPAPPHQSVGHLAPATRDPISCHKPNAWMLALFITAVGISCCLINSLTKKTVRVPAQPDTWSRHCPPPPTHSRGPALLL